MSTPASRLVQRGVLLPHPESVWIASDVPLERIAPGVVLHPGCRISGADTSIGPGCELGAEGPVTLDRCQLGHGVRLKGGSMSQSTFWDRVELGGAAQVRPGCLLEEESSGGHGVGLKQTVLFPFVTLGSLINFCDLLMSGGTSRKDHGEVGSSYIHFNFTPHQDKATASLLGEVPRGVMLDQPPIFLGGQGGLVGPRRLAFGTVVAAGGICRQDVLKERTLHVPAPLVPGDRPFDARRFGLVEHRIAACVHYLAQIRALQDWYRYARPRFTGGDAYREACVDGGRQRLAAIWEERVKRIGELVEKMDESIRHLLPGSPSAARARREQEGVLLGWPRLAAHLARMATEELAPAERAKWLQFEPPVGSDYVTAVREWPAPVRAAGTAWLQAVVDTVCAGWHPPAPVS